MSSTISEPPKEGPEILNRIESTYATHKNPFGRQPDLLTQFPPRKALGAGRKALGVHAIWDMNDFVFADLTRISKPP
jgi:hypothetical protein